MKKHHSAKLELTETKRQNLPLGRQGLIEMKAKTLYLEHVQAAQLFWGRARAGNLFWRQLTEAEPKK